MAILTRRAPAAANYSGNVGLVVMENGATAGECILAGAATSAVTGAALIAAGNRPLGVIISAENALGGAVTIAGPGEFAYALFTGVIAKEAGDQLMSDANSQCVLAAVAGGNTVVHSIGRYVPMTDVATQAGGLHRILVTCEVAVLA